MFGAVEIVCAQAVRLQRRTTCVCGIAKLSATVPDPDKTGSVLTKEFLNENEDAIDDNDKDLFNKSVEKAEAHRARHPPVRKGGSSHAQPDASTTNEDSSTVTRGSTPQSSSSSAAGDRNQSDLAQPRRPTAVVEASDYDPAVRWANSGSG